MLKYFVYKNHNISKKISPEISLGPDKPTPLTFKVKPAQQLVEFLLIVPFMMIIFGILTEYAYALNTYMTVQEGLKTVTSQLYSKIKPNTSAIDIKNIVQTDLKTYLEANNVPTRTENTIEVGYDIEGSSAIFIASYKYIPAFTLPNVYFKLLPDEFNFFANSVVPKAFLSSNKYNNSIDSKDLDGIWAGSASFASLDAFNASKQGILTTPVGGDPSGKNTETSIIFLIPTANANEYAMVDWSGEVETCTMSTNTGTLTGTSCADPGMKFIDYLKNNNYYNVMFVHDDEATPDNLSDLASYWAVGSGQLADKTADGILKRTMALIDTSNESIGDYDKIDSAYTIKTFGSIVFVTMGDTIANIIGGESESTYVKDYTVNFGSK